MSENPNTPPQSEAKPKAAAEEKPVEEAPAPLPFGPIGQRLMDAGLAVEALAPDATGKEAVRVAPEHLIAVAQYLREQCAFDLLVSVSGVDWKTHRESVVHLYSTHTHEYLTLKTNAQPGSTGAEDVIPSLVPVWPAANWHERETFDLMGIHYEGHPDMRRILMPVDWVGYPLRKDYKEEDPRLVWNRR